MKINIVNIQRFSTHDGPGIRTTVFFKGCSLNCVWCHNPETKKASAQIFYNERFCMGCGNCAKACKNDAHVFMGDLHRFLVNQCRGCQACVNACYTGAIECAGRFAETDEIIETALRDADFYNTEGGITLSGGEPMFQAEGCIELLEKAKAKGIATVMETSGFFDNKYIPKIASVTDLFLYDIKDSNEDRHKKYVGASNKEIMENLFILDGCGARTVLRCIMVNGINTEEGHISNIAQVYRKLKHCTGVEILPYHSYGGSKNKLLGYDDNGNKEWIPDKQQIRQIRSTLRKAGCVVLN